MKKSARKQPIDDSPPLAFESNLEPVHQLRSGQPVQKTPTDTVSPGADFLDFVENYMLAIHTEDPKHPRLDPQLAIDRHGITLRRVQRAIRELWSRAYGNERDRDGAREEVVRFRHMQQEIVQERTRLESRKICEADRMVHLQFHFASAMSWVESLALWGTYLELGDKGEEWLLTEFPMFLRGGGAEHLLQQWWVRKLISEWTHQAHLSVKDEKKELKGKLARLLIKDKRGRPKDQDLSVLSEEQREERDRNKNTEIVRESRRREYLEDMKKRFLKDTASITNPRELDRSIRNLVEKIKESSGGQAKQMAKKDFIKWVKTTQLPALAPLLLRRL